MTNFAEFDTMSFMSKRLKGMTRYSALGNLVLDGDKQDAGLDPEIAQAQDAATAQKITVALEQFDGGEAERRQGHDPFKS